MSKNERLATIKKMTLQEYFPIIDNHVIWSIKQDFIKKYSYLIHSILKDNNPQTEEVIISPSNKYQIIKLPVENEYEFEYWKKLDVVWLYSIDRILSKEIKHLKFEFWAVGYISLSGNYYSAETIDPFKYHLKKVQDLRIKASKDLNIPSLQSYKSDYLNNDFVGKFLEICRSTKPLKKFEDFFFAYDLLYISQDLSYTLSELNLFKPYLRNFLEDPIRMSKETIYRYFPSFYDKQYFHLASNYMQSLYNYWDRIGDLLYQYFEFPRLKERDVYFDRIINQFPEKFKNEDFKYLEDFLQREYKEFSEDRKQIVHYKGLESKVFSEYMNINSKMEDIQRLQDWKVGLIDNFYGLHKKSLKGIEKVLKLIEKRN